MIRLLSADRSILISTPALHQRLHFEREWGGSIVRRWGRQSYEFHNNACLVIHRAGEAGSRPDRRRKISIGISLGVPGSRLIIDGGRAGLARAGML